MLSCCSETSRHSQRVYASKHLSSDRNYHVLCCLHLSTVYTFPLCSLTCLWDSLLKEKLKTYKQVIIRCNFHSNWRWVMIDWNMSGKGIGYNFGTSAYPRDPTFRWEEVTTTTCLCPCVGVGCITQTTTSNPCIGVVNAPHKPTPLWLLLGTKCNWRQTCITCLYSCYRSS